MYNLGIEAFLAVVQAQSVSRAAEQLNLAQSTVSKRLKVLEQELNTTLLDRGKGNKTLKLTLSGEAFIDLAERWQALWRETQYLKTSSPNPTLSIGTLDSMNYAIFPNLFRALSMHQPRMNLKVVTSHSSELYDLIEQRRVDVAFTTLRREHPNITVEKCFSDSMVGIRIGMPTRSENEVFHPHDLDANNELFVYWGPENQIWHNQWWNPSCPGQIRLDSAQLILSFLHAERQWAIVPLSVAQAAQKKGDYNIFRFSEAVPDRICYKLTYRYSKASTLASIKILDHYMKMLQEGLL